MQQELKLGHNRTAAELVQRIKGGVSRFVRVALHRNRVTMASVRFERDGSATLRLHEEFRKAPDAVLDALCRYLEQGRARDWKPVQSFALRISPRERGSSPEKPQPKGTHVHDLAAIAREINQRFFNGRVTCSVLWGRRGSASSRRRRSIRYGSWNETTREVRVHPALDDERVPRAFVEYIVYHELLHAVVPPRRKEGRRLVHHATFRSLERRFPDYPRMKQLARELLSILQ